MSRSGQLLPRFAVFVALAALPGLFATPNWDGSNGNASSASRWGTTSAPGNSDHANVGNGNVTIDVALTFGALTLSGGNLNGSNTLTLGTLTASTWSGGSLTFSSGAGLAISSGGTLNISSSSDKNFNGSALNNSGTINWSSGALLSGNGGTITNASGATFNDQTGTGSTNYVWDFHGGSLAFTNHGNFNKTGAGLTEFRSTFTNNGNVSVQNGTLRFTENTTHGASASFSVSSGANVEMSGGTHSLGNGTSLGGAGQYKVNGGTLSVAAGNASVSNLLLSTGAVDGAGAVSVGVLNASGGSLSIGSLSLTGANSAWSGGDWSTSSASQTTVNSGASFTVSTNDHYFNRRTFTNNGTTTWSGGALRSGNAAGITNNANWNDTSASSVFADNYYGGTAWAFTNASTGTYTKSGTGTTTFSVGFHNQGSVNVSGGTMILNGGGSTASTGSFSVGNGAVLRFAGGTHTIANGASLGGAGSYELTNGTLDVTGAVTVSSFNQSGGSLAGTHTLQGGTYTWSGGDWNASSSGYSTTIASGATLALGNGISHDFERRNVTNSGTINWAGNHLRSGNGGSLTNGSGATFNDQAASGTNYIYAYYGGAFTFTNNGTYHKSGAATTQVDTTFNNNANVNVAAGTLRINGGGTNSGTGVFNTASGATTLFSGSYAIANGASLTGAGTYALSNGTLTITGDVLVSTFNQSGGSLGNSHRFTGGTFNWNGGDWNSATSGQTTTIGTGATLNLSSGTTHDFERRAVTNEGTVNWSGNHLRSGNNGTWTNATGATFNDQGTSGTNYVYSYYGGAFSFTNNGSYQKSGGATTQFDTTFNNNASVNIGSGILKINGGGTNSSSGIFNTASGATTEFSSNYTIANGSSLTGTGAYKLSNGTLSIGGDVLVSTFNQTGGSLGNSHRFTGGTINWTGGDWNSASSGLTTTIGAAATLNLSNSTTHDSERRSVTNEGTVNWTGNHIRSGNNGTWTNAAGATFNDQGASGTNYVYAYFGGAFTFTNNGSYHKSGGATTQFDTTLDNNASINVGAGTLKINGGGTNSSSGVFNTSAGATTEFSNNYIIANGSSLTGAGAYKLSNGTLGISGDILVSTFTQTGGSLGNSHRFTGGVVNWNGGNWNSATSGLTTTIATAATVNLSDATVHDFERRAIVNQGTMNWVGNHLRSGNGGTLTNAAGAAINDQGTSGTNYIYSYYGGSFTVTNNGTYHKSGAATTQVDTVFNNNAQVNVANGIFRLNGGGTNSGSGVFNTSAGATTQFSSDYSIANGSSLTGLGVYALIAGRLTITGDLTVGSFNQSGGVFAGTNRLLGGHFTWSGGDWNGNAGETTTIGSGAFVTLDSASAHDFERRAITNEGTIYWAGNHLRSGNGGSFTNAIGAVFNDQNASGTAYIYSYYGGSFGFTNAGTYAKSGAGTTQVDIPFTNNGSIVVSAGLLRFTSSFTHTAGNIAVANNATIRFDQNPNFGTGMLFGTGTIHASSVTAGGIIAPGNSAGALTFTGDLTMLGTATTMIEIGGTTQGTTYDFLNIGGNAVVAGNLSLSFINGFQNTVSPANVFTILSANGTGGLTGAFANIVSGQRLITSDGFGSFQVNYGGGLNAVTLTNFQSIPEPSTYALMGLGLAALLAARRRRK